MFYLNPPALVHMVHKGVKLETNQSVHITGVKKCCNYALTDIIESGN